LINLAGHTINCRHNAENKTKILDSRIRTTSLLGEALLKCNTPPAVWINASASAIYQYDDNKVSDENATQISSSFLSKVVQEWEAVFFNFKLENTRQIALRTSVVLGNGGAFKTIYKLVRLGLGGKVGSGKQHFSWIHLDDYVRIVEFLIQTAEIEGVVNVCSPNPVTNSGLMKMFRKEAGVAVGLPAPTFAVKMGAVLLGTEASLVLDGSYMIPMKLIKSGFKFQFPDLSLAIRNLLNK
jgi:uncharacterized protein (TIGR01777 family)